MSQRTDLEQFIRQVEQLQQAAAAIPLGQGALPERRAPVADAPRVLIFSPHPDDECIIGLLPLRLAAECGWRVINVPVTHGSKLDRQRGRHEELQQACEVLGWELESAPEPRDGQEFPSFRLEEIVALLTRIQPQAILFPHITDWNSRHISTHHLLMDALALMDAEFRCHVFETEFWGAMDDPNLMLEAGREQLVDLLQALLCHQGELQRNPYHLSLPAWMIDNVRRGSERVLGQGGQAPAFSFATLYRHSIYTKNRLQPQTSRILSCEESVEALFGPFS